MLQNLAKWIIGVGGWTMVGRLPAYDKVVFIAASHTSNWDGFWLILYKLAIDVRIRFLAKHSLFWWPLGNSLRWLGAMPIDRSQTASTVDRIVAEFATEKRLLLALAPEGTRRWQPYWKTGFYQIAVAAGVPITLCFIDYSSKRMGIGITLTPSGDALRDLAIMRDFYEPMVPRHPDQKGPVEFPPA